MSSTGTIFRTQHRTRPARWMAKPAEDRGGPPSRATRPLPSAYGAPPMSAQARRRLRGRSRQSRRPVPATFLFQSLVAEPSSPGFHPPTFTSGSPRYWRPLKQNICCNYNVKVSEYSVLAANLSDSVSFAFPLIGSSLSSLQQCPSGVGCGGWASGGVMPADVRERGGVLRDGVRPERLLPDATLLASRPGRVLCPRLLLPYCFRYPDRFY